MTVEATISQDDAQRMIKNYKGSQFFTVVFVKRTNGELRTMNCRKGVYKGVKGVGLSFDPVAKRLVGVYDVAKRQHRFISLDSIKSVRIQGNRYLVKA